MRNKVIRDAQILKLLDFGGYKIFESSDIQTMVMLFMRNKQQTEYTFDYRKLSGGAAIFNDVMDLLDHADNERAHYLTPVIDRKDFTNKLLTFSDRSKERLLDKIQSKANFRFSDKQEVSTGIDVHQDFLNKTSQRELGEGFEVGDGIFCISDQEKKELNLGEEEKKLVKPYYTTNELFKYFGEPKNKYWVIYTDSSFKDPRKIRTYPNLKRHLDRFNSIITSDNAPYGLHRARKEYFFKGEKIISLRKCAEPTFTYTNYDCYVSQTFFVIKSLRINLKFLTGLLNSRLIAFWLRHKGKMQGDQFQVDKEPLLKIPIVKPTAEDAFVKLADQILSAKQKKSNADTSALEREIDEIVYRLYSLTKEEIRIVEGGR
jgi:adenine-specific DNA-methyltransferase